MKNYLFVGSLLVLLTLVSGLYASPEKHICPAATEMKSNNSSKYQYTQGFVQFLDTTNGPAVLLKEKADDPILAAADRDKALNALSNTKVPKQQSSERGEVCVYTGVYSEDNTSVMQFPIIVARAIPQQ